MNKYISCPFVLWACKLKSIKHQNISLVNTHTQTHTLSLSLSLTHTHTHTCTHARARTHTHTQAKRAKSVLVSQIFARPSDLIAQCCFCSAIGSLCLLSSGADWNWNRMSWSRHPHGFTSGGNSVPSHVMMHTKAKSHLLIHLQVLSSQHFL